MAGSPSRPPTGKTLLKLAGVLLVTGLLGAGVLLPYVGGLGILAGRETGQFLNTTCNLTETPPPQRTTIYARDGKTVIATLFSENRQLVPLRQVPKQLQQALIDTEDRRFYQHHGVDMRGLIRSAVNTGSGDTQGGSTLTMQYVKQVRYYQAIGNPAKQREAISQTLKRKMEDAQCAIEWEKHETKDQILDNYLNIAFFGEHAYGIQVAARTYFNKNVSELTLPESALLVGLLRAPSLYDPFNNLKAAKDRRNQVIQNMVDVGDLSAAEGAKYRAAPVSLATTQAPPVPEGCTAADKKLDNVGFFCEYVKNWLVNNNGISENTLDTGGLKIVTTLDPTVQNTVQKGLAAKFPATSKMTAIMPVVDPKTGDVLAMASSKAYGNAADGKHTANPIFTDASAAGASTFKLFDLVTALKTGVPTDWTLEAPDPYNTTTCPAYTWNNVAGEFFPTTDTLADATARSSNTFFIEMADKLFASCDLSPYVNTAISLGVDSLKSRVKDITSQQLTGFMIGSGFTASPLEIAGAYAAVANDGVFCRPAPVLSITGQNGKAITVKRTPCSPQMSPQVAREALDVLTGDTQGPGTTAGVFAPYYASAGQSRVIAGKTGTGTGTNNSNSSLWFVGVTPTMVASTALINIANPSAPAAGLPGISDADAANSPNVTGAISAALWLNAMNPLLANQTWSWPDPDAIPSGIQVQSVVGQPLAQATAALTAQGFKVNALNGGQPYCGSQQAYDSVGYQSPTVAKPGSTITLCVSDGSAPYIPPPPPPPPPPPAPPATTHPTAPPTHPAGTPAPPPTHGGGGGPGHGGGSGHGGGTPPRH